MADPTFHLVSTPQGVLGYWSDGRVYEMLTDYKTDPGMPRVTFRALGVCDRAAPWPEHPRRAPEPTPDIPTRETPEPRVGRWQPASHMWHCSCPDGLKWNLAEVAQCAYCGAVRPPAPVAD